MRMKKWQLLLVLLSYSGFLYSMINEEELSAYYLHPHRDFYHIEVACQQLWKDLDLMLTSIPFAQEICSKAWLLHGQCVALYKSVCTLAQFSEEFYLPEDIEYLLLMVCLLAAKYKQVCTQLSIQEQDAETIFSSIRNDLYLILEESKKVVQ